MKFNKFLFAALLMLATSVSFVSCSNDDEPAEPINAALIGSWGRVSTMQIAGVQVNTIVLLTFNEDYTATDKTRMLENGEVALERELPFTYEYDGVILTLTNSLNGVVSEYGVSVARDILTMTYLETSTAYVYTRVN